MQTFLFANCDVAKVVIIQKNISQIWCMPYMKEGSFYTLGYLTIKIESPGKQIKIWQINSTKVPLKIIFVRSELDKNLPVKQSLNLIRVWEGDTSHNGNKAQQTSLLVVQNCCLGQLLFVMTNCSALHHDWCLCKILLT